MKWQDAGQPSEEAAALEEDWGDPPLLGWNLSSSLLCLVELGLTVLSLESIE